MRVVASKVHALHILVKTEPEANEILFDLRRGADFGGVAKARSICPSAKKGGDLGCFGRNQMVKEFETLAFSLPVNELGKCKTEFGWHVVKVVETK